MTMRAVLAIPAYRRFLLAVVATETSLIVAETALLWTTLEGTSSTVLVGLLYAAFTLPMLVFVVPVGVLTDRAGPRGPMLASASVSAAVLALAAALALYGGLSAPTALVLGTLEGVFYGFWSVPGQVFPIRIVSPRLAPGAIALISLQAGLGPLLGGLVGGWALGAGGAPLSLLLATCGMAIAALAVATLPSVPGLAAEGSPVTLGSLGAIICSCLANRSILALMAIGTTGAGLIMSRFALFPIVARDALDAGAQGLGLLVAASGAGSLAGTALTDLLGARLGRGRAAIASLAAAGLGLTLLAAAAPLMISLTIAAVIAGAIVLQQMTTLTLLQLLVKPEVRARVVALYEFSRWALMPIGSIVGGVLAGGWGVSGVLLLFGGLTVAISALIVVANRRILALDIDGLTG